MSEPIFPLILISKSDFVEILHRKGVFTNASVSRINKDFGDICYDCTGIEWHYVLDPESSVKISFWKRIFNLKVLVIAIFTKSGEYDLEELKLKLEICVDKDDDILTQYEEPDIIKAAIKKSVSFSEILSVLNKYVFDVDEEEILKDQESRGMPE